LFVDMPTLDDNPVPVATPQWLWMEGCRWNDPHRTWIPLRARQWTHLCLMTMSAQQVHLATAPGALGATLDSVVVTHTAETLGEGAEALHDRQRAEDTELLNPVPGPAHVLMAQSLLPGWTHRFSKCHNGRWYKIDVTRYSAGFSCVIQFDDE
jgi:hypothetical protein